MNNLTFSQKTLLITGGTGSFGNAVLERFLQTDIREIRIFSRDEKKQDDMRKRYRSDKLRFYIGDVRDEGSVREAMRGVDYCFHAAALKQVPSCEFFPMEAVKTNVYGTHNVLTAAINEKVNKVVCLSTDKAAYPINAMGISKAMMEKVIVAAARNATDTVISCTRYGNVMCSRGSVIPLFIDQIKEGKPITVTDPSMTRFQMSLQDAVELVLYAFNHAQPGDLFIQKAPASTIGDLAQAVSELFGALEPMQIIGIRHGEKKFETLATAEERAKAQEMDRYFRIPADNRDLNYGMYLDAGTLDAVASEPYTSHNTQQLDLPQIKALLQTLPYVREQLATWERRR